MTFMRKFFSWLETKLDTWLSRVGEQNRPIEHEYDCLPDEGRHIQRSDLMGDEHGDWDDRHL